MLPIPAGTFERGCDPAHAYLGVCRSDLELYTVYLDTYRIDQTEVTNAQYARCVAAGGCTEPASYSSAGRFPYYGDPTYANHPVIWVNWYQASAYCAWAGKRLPTAAEWEKAARGASDTRPFPWGDADPSCDVTNFSSCTGDTTAVGSYPAGASPYGVLDMSGNVAEWVNDWTRSNYDRRFFASNPLGAASGLSKETLGGNWASYSGDVSANGGIVHYSLSSSRGENTPFSRGDNLGFRCAASVDDQTGQSTPVETGVGPTELSVATALPPIQTTPPQPGKAGAAGRVLWNNQPVRGLAVKICTHYSPFGGCSGKEYTSKTDPQGVFVFENVTPNPYYLLVHAIDVDGWFFQRLANAWSYASPITTSLTAGQARVFEDMHIWKYDLKGGSAKPGEKPDRETATLSWKAYPGAAYYGVYIGEQQLGEPGGERANGNSITVTKPPVCKWWKIEAFNAQGIKIAQSDYLDFGVLCGGAAKPVAPRPPALPTARAGPAPGSGAGQPIPFQTIACPTQGVAITAITAARPGWWNISGSAEIANLDYWKGEISADGQGWTVLYRSSSPVRNGVLIEFNTGTVPHGTYQVRLLAVDRTGNYPEPCIIQVSIR
jgi:formylglycine-generating enzyme required for sulfatase activity